MLAESTLRMTGLILGGFLLLVFVGYAALSGREPIEPLELNSPRRIAGVFSLTTGVLMSVTWLVLMSTSGNSYIGEHHRPWAHIAVQFSCSCALLVAGVALLRRWSRGPALFLLASAALILDLFLTFLAYGVTGHAFLLGGASYLIVLLGVYFVTLIYGWQHFVLRLDQGA